MVANTPDEFDTVAKLDIPPHPRILKGIGLNHSLETAMADLVDNSIEAKASRILIRLVLQDGHIRQMLVVDNGNGMNRRDIDSAMRLARAEEDDQSRLGYFGLGLKAASFSQASRLTVLSHRHRSPVQGRLLRRDQASPILQCEILDTQQSAGYMKRYRGYLNKGVGTIVRWDELRNVPASNDPAVTNAFIERRVAELRHHLGLIFHRFLEQNSIEIGIDVFDIAANESGFVFTVEPIDPFGYSRSGSPDYPKVLMAELGTDELPIRCHIWPGGSDSPFFKLVGGGTDAYQGFFLYRNDRLLSLGGWSGVVQEDKRRKLARVEIDIEDHLEYFSMTMEKSGVRMTPDLVHAIEGSQSQDGTTFHEYLAAAENVFRESNKRVRRRKPVLKPGQGVPNHVARIIGRELSFIENQAPLNIRWKKWSADDFVLVDRESQTLWLNATYRSAVLKGLHGGLSDAPLLKTLLFMLYQELFSGAVLGARDRDNVSMWNSILTAAAKAERKQFDE